MKCFRIINCWRGSSTILPSILSNHFVLKMSKEKNFYLRFLMQATPYIYKSSCKASLMAAALWPIMSTVPVYAETKISRPALQKLADQFVDKIGAGLNEADKKIEDALYHDKNSIGKAVQLSTEGAQTYISDGTELLMTVVAGEHKVPFKFEVFAIKKERDIQVSLADFFGAADFPITVNAEDGTAAGWFIRENQRFALDVNAGTVTVNGVPKEFNSNLVTMENGEIYVTTFALSQWFDMRFIHDYSELALHVSAPYLFPAEENYLRQTRRENRVTSNAKPKEPQLSTPYKLLSKPNGEFSLRNSYLKNDATTNTDSYWNIITSNDVGYHGLNTFLTGTDEDKLTSARFTFERNSDEANLLGALKAKQYMFGDVYTAQLPLTGGSNQELGVFITNKSPHSSTTDSSTTFQGTGSPGWDVELYRENSFISMMTIEDDGRYRFEDVLLFFGDNNFRLVFYGPQGEIQVEERNIPVYADSQIGQNWEYTASLTAKDRMSYEKNRQSSEENDTPHLTVSAKRQYKDMTLSTGFNHYQIGTNKRTYIQAGIAKQINGALVNFNAAHELEDQGTVFEAITRRSYGPRSFAGSIQINNSQYTNTATIADDPRLVESSLEYRNSSSQFFGLSSSHHAGSNLQLFKSGDRVLQNTAGLDMRIKNTMLSSSLTHNYNDITGVDDPHLVNAAFNLRGQYNLARWYLNGSYEIYPESQLEKVQASVDFPLNQDIDAKLELDHEIQVSKTKASARLNWQHEKMTISPYISADTDHVIQATLNTRFGLGTHHSDKKIDIYNKRMAYAGSLTARVFLDYNGNGEYDTGDELLPEARIDAVQMRKEAFTNQNGIAHIPDLSSGVLTDIKLDTSSLEDPYWIPSYSGVSIRPRAGSFHEVDFPVVISGEIDGTLRRNKNEIANLAKNYRLKLTRPDGIVESTTVTAFDGFYIFNNISPGEYYLTIDERDTRATGFIAPKPQLITLKPDGTTIYSNDILMQPGNAFGYRFSSNGHPTNNRKVTVPRPSVKRYNIEVGQYKSKLRLGLDWYRLQRKLAQLDGDFELITEVSDIKRNAETKRYTLPLRAKHNDLDKYTKTCTDLAEMGFDCTLHIHTIYDTQTAENSAEPDKNS